MNVNRRIHIASRAGLPIVIAALPSVLLLSSLRTLHEIGEQRSIYLRHRVALLAGRLENLPAATPAGEIVESLSEEEPNLVGVHVIERGTASDTPSLRPIWEGRELFQTELAMDGDIQVFRAYVPFHSNGGLRIGRIELAGSAADFLVVHARHNVIVSSVGGLVVVALSILALRAVRQAERMRLRQLEMEHLAHIGKMSAVLAHEIRNPLGAIKGFVQLAGESAGQTTRDLLAPALSETRRLESLVNDLLAYGRPPIPNPRTVAWSEIAKDIERHAIHMASGRPIGIVVPERQLELHTDPALLGQALLNLVRNAVEAAPPHAGGEVRIEAQPDGARGVTIAVRDDGAGISDEALAKLCEPFYTTKASGTGLGLAITKKLITALEGRLELRRLDGRGTEALIRLPEARREARVLAGEYHGTHSDC